MSHKVVDVDSHTCEPTGIWEENLEPEYRDRALRMKVDDNGWEYLEVDGKKPDYNFFLSRGIFGRDSAVKRSGEELEHAMTPGNITYEEGRQMLPAAQDPGERVKMLDSEGIDVSMLIDLFSISWDPECSDAKLAAAYARVANDWLIDHCSSFPSRLVPIPHIPMRDPEEAARELRRVAKLGVKAVTICCRPFNGIPFGGSVLRSVLGRSPRDRHARGFSHPWSRQLHGQRALPGPSPQEVDLVGIRHAARRHDRGLHEPHLGGRPGSLPEAEGRPHGGRGQLDPMVARPYG